MPAKPSRTHHPHSIYTRIFVFCQTSNRSCLQIEDSYGIKEKLSKLPPWKIGKYGQIQEWYEDYEEVDVKHRHVSHLYGLYPAFPFDSVIASHKQPLYSQNFHLSEKGGEHRISSHKFLLPELRKRISLELQENESSSSSSASCKNIFQRSRAFAPCIYLKILILFLL